MVVVEEEVLGLEVAVGVAFGVDEGEGGDDLAEEEARLGLAQAVFGDDVVEEFAARAVLEKVEKVEKFLK